MKISTDTVITGRHYQTLSSVQLDVRGGKIVSLRDAPEDAREPLPWIAPGFVDLQCNGYGGHEFSSPELAVEHVVEIAARQASFGVTRFCPTVTTASFATIVHGLRTIVEACRGSSDVARCVAGIHLEGPYIAAEDGPRGAHPREHCRAPDWNEFQRFQEAADGQIRLVTLSPEYVESPDFIRRAAGAGVVVALGHTSADSAQIRAAVDAGARLSTHLGNGAHRMLRRHPNYVWDQLAEDRLSASLIVDGHHLPAEVVQTFVRAKGPERCILVSDLSGLAGLPPGHYATQLCYLEILGDGRLVIAGQDQLLAGASQPLGVGIANVMRFAGVDLALAVRMASHNPARLLGHFVGDLQPGDSADLTVFRLHNPAGELPQRLEILATISGGRLLYSASN